MSDAVGLILYRTEDGRDAVQLRASEGTVWMTQAEMAALFDTTVQNVNLHLKNIEADGELDALAVIKESLQTDRFLAFNEQSLLHGAGQVSRETMEGIIAERFATFEAARRAAETEGAEREAGEELEALVRHAGAIKPGRAS